MRKQLGLYLTIITLGGLVLFLEATDSLAQGRMRKGGPGGDMKIDPNRIFSFISRGQPFIEISKSFKDRDVMELFAKQNGITDGKITQEQFGKYWEQRDKLREEVQKNGGGSDKGPGGRGPGPDPEGMFKRFDTNGDGFLNEDEISQTKSFREEWQKWDTNKDGRISLEEFKNYLTARLQERMDRKDGDRRDGKKDGDPKTAEKKDEKKDEKKESVTRIEIEEVENIPPVVYRVGKLPKELPPWFTELDLNKDGQVSLMEWMKADKAMNEFTKMDRNDDGLLTPEEVLRFQRLTAPPAKGENIATATNNGPPTANGAPPAFNRVPGMGKGGQRPGGIPGWMGKKGGGKKGGGKKGNRGFQP